MQVGLLNLAIATVSCLCFCFWSEFKFFWFVSLWMQVVSGLVAPRTFWLPNALLFIFFWPLRFLKKFKKKKKKKKTRNTHNKLFPIDYTMKCMTAVRPGVVLTAAISSTSICQQFWCFFFFLGNFSICKLTTINLLLLQN